MKKCIFLETLHVFATLKKQPIFWGSDVIYKANRKIYAEGQKMARAGARAALHLVLPAFPSAAPRRFFARSACVRAMRSL